MSGQRSILPHFIAFVGRLWRLPADEVPGNAVDMIREDHPAVKGVDRFTLPQINEQTVVVGPATATDSCVEPAEFFTEPSWAAGGPEHHCRRASWFLGEDGDARQNA